MVSSAWDYVFPQRAGVCPQPPRRTRVTSWRLCFRTGCWAHGGLCCMLALEPVLQEQQRFLSFWGCIFDASDPFRLVELSARES